MEKETIKALAETTARATAAALVANAVVAEESYKGKASGKNFRIVYVEKSGKYEFNINGSDAGSSPAATLDEAKRKAHALADYLGGK